MSAHQLYESLSIEVINRFVEEQQEEHLHLDFKSIGDPSLSKDDRRNLAKALSGFANSDGGLIIWGVDARKNSAGVDCACALKPVSFLPALVSRLNGLTGEAVSPTVDGILHKRIPIDQDSGFAATYVPASDSGPHMARSGDDRYYKRSGDSFYRMEHFDIADMFGKRRRPVLEIFSRITRGSTIRSEGMVLYKVHILLGISNRGRGSAMAPYLGLNLKNPYQLAQHGIDGNFGLGLSRQITAEGAWIRYGGVVHTAIHPGTTLDITAITSEFRVPGPEPPSLVLPYEIAAEDFPLYRGVLQVGSEQIREAVLGMTSQ
jgi:hypothetical protein